MRFIQRSYLIAGSVFIIICSVLCLRIFLNPEIKTIFPQPRNIQIKTYTDAEDPLGVGNSRIISFTVDSAVFLSTIIGGDIDYPYAGFRIQPLDSNPFYNIKHYDHLHIDIDSTNATFFIIDLTTYVEGYSHFDDHMSFRHHTKELFVSSGPQKMSIPMKSILTQGWWYDLRKINPSELDKPDFTRCHTISFEINAVKASDRELYMKVSRIHFEDTKNEWLITAIALGICWFGFLIFAIKKNKNTQSKPVTAIKIKNVELKNYADEELDRVCSYIAEQYSNPQLSINIVSRGAGVSVAKIPNLLMQTHKMQYKYYLNTVRITEAKRLLRETDCQISDIALAVGYIYTTTFNRVFKEITEVSPSNYRKNTGESPIAERCV